MQSERRSAVDTVAVVRESSQKTDTDFIDIRLSRYEKILYCHHASIEHEICTISCSFQL